MPPQKENEIGRPNNDINFQNRLHNNSKKKHLKAASFQSTFLSERARKGQDCWNLSAGGCAERCGGGCAQQSAAGCAERWAAGTAEGLAVGSAEGSAAGKCPERGAGAVGKVPDERQTSS